MKIVEIITRAGSVLLRGSLEDNGYEREIHRGKETGMCRVPLAATAGAPDGTDEPYAFVEYQDEADYMEHSGLDRDDAESNLARL